MTIYSNGDPVVLELAPHAPRLTRPLIQPVPDMAAGTRAYSLGQYTPRSAHVLVVTGAGHWFRTGDEPDPETFPHMGWTCRGCNNVQLGVLFDRKFGRCPRPPEGQDVASALLGRQAVAV